MSLRRVLSRAVAAGALAMLGAAPLAAQDAVVLHAGPVKDSTGPIVELDAAFWKDAPPMKVEMLPQTITDPKNPSPAVTELTVRAVHNGQWLAFLIEWADPTKSDRIVVDQFGDQVAVEMPVEYKPGEMPNPMMGAPGERVNIMQWRAAFQHDLDANEENGPTPADLYPNIHVDIYPDDILRATDARAYTGAVGVDNPISRPKRSPVLEQMAEGFGTLTVLPQQQADGRGVWADGRWRVVITRPLAAGDKSSPNLGPGDRSLAAFAVWDGDAKEVGARKAWANWVELSLDPMRP
jgi:hypothetical protein